MKLLLGFLLCCLDLGLAGRTRDVRSLEQNDPEKRVVCYYSSWASYRTGDSKFEPEDIDPTVCTHVLYAYATFTKDYTGIEPFDLKQDLVMLGYKKFIELKKTNPKLKLMLSLGGSKLGPARFSKVAGDPHLRSQFAKNSLEFLSRYGFDGLDLVWKYPNSTKDTSVSDKRNYVKLLQELRDKYEDSYIISIAVPPLPETIESGFDIPELSKYVDFMTILTYDYHHYTEPFANHLAPLFPLSKDLDKNLNIDSTIRNYMGLNVAPSKLNLAIALYGDQFILERAENTAIGSTTRTQGLGTEDLGLEIYNSFCKKIKEESWTVTHENKSAVGPYAFKDDHWLCYDDEEMIRTKARYVLEKGLGGVTFWSLDMDDFLGRCHSRKYPLISAAKETLLGDTKDASDDSPRELSPSNGDLKISNRYMISQFLKLLFKLSTIEEQET